MPLYMNVTRISNGNEAFGLGRKYAQAILLYSLALDKADELPIRGSEEAISSTDIIFSNKLFLETWTAERTLVYVRAQINPITSKTVFRHGLFSRIGSLRSNTYLSRNPTSWSQRATN
jgi:hypothetical protein